MILYFSSCCVNNKTPSKLSEGTHAVINPVIVLFLGLEVGLGREAARMRLQTGKEGEVMEGTVRRRA